MRKVLQSIAWLLAAAIAILSPAVAQQFGPPASMFGGASEQYASKCAGCHGDTLAGGRGPSLFAESLLSETTDAALANAILNGVPKGGMPAFKGQLSEAEINQLIAFLRIRSGQLKGMPSFLPNPDGQVVKSEKQTFRIDVVAADLNTPWGAVFLPDGRMLLTERPGRIRFLDKGKLSEPVKNTPVPMGAPGRRLLRHRHRPRLQEERLGLPFLFRRGAGRGAAGGGPARCAALDDGCGAAQHDALGARAHQCRQRMGGPAGCAADARGNLFDQRHPLRLAVLLRPEGASVHHHG
jgi:hypothetical protein